MRDARLRLRTAVLAGALAICLVPTTACSPVGAPATEPSSSTTVGALPAASAESSPPPIPDHLQTVNGLGVNANVHSWKNGELKPAIDMIADLGQVTWRVIIDRADWEPTRHGDPLVYDWTYYAGIYDHGKMADLWNTVAYINSKTGQQVMINVMGGVPGWMGGTRITPELEDYWVRMISSMVYYGKVVKKLDFSLLGPMNEQDWNGIEGPQVDDEQYVRLLHKLANRLDSLGLSDVRFVGPDTAGAANARNGYLPKLEADPTVMAKLTHVGIHSYDGDTAGIAPQLSAAAKPGPDLWVTEFSSWCTGCDEGAPSPGNWDYALGTAGYAISLLRDGASGLQFYDAWDGYYEHHQSMGYWGALAYDSAQRTYSPRKSYFVLKQLISYFPRGSTVLPSTADNPSVEVVAAMDPITGRLVVFGRNTSSDNVSTVIGIAGVNASTKLETFRTDDEENMVKEPDQMLSQGKIALTIAARSVFTLTGVRTNGN